MPLLLQCFASGLRCHSFNLLTCCNLLNYESSYGPLAIRACRLRGCTFYHATYTLLIWPFSLTFALTFLSDQGRLPTRAVYRVIGFAWSHNCSKLHSWIVSGFIFFPVGRHIPIIVLIFVSYLYIFSYGSNEGRYLFYFPPRFDVKWKKSMSTECTHNF